MWGDIRGETLPTVDDRMSTDEAIFGVAGATLGLAGAAFSPWLGLFGMAASMGVFNIGLHLGGSAIKAVGRAVIPAAKSAYNFSNAAVRGAWANRGGLMATARIAGAGLAATAGTGLSAAASGLSGVAGIAGIAGTMGAVGVGLGAGIYQGRAAEREANRQAFTASANGYMARGAAMRNKRQGHY